MILWKCKMLQFCLSVFLTICPSVCLSSVLDKWQVNIREPSNLSHFPGLGGGGKMHLERREVRLRMISIQNMCQIDYSHKVESIQWRCKIAEESNFLHGVTMDFLFLLLYIRIMKGSFNTNFSVSQIDILPCLVSFWYFPQHFHWLKKWIRVIPLIDSFCRKFTIGKA